MNKFPKVAIILLNYNGLEDTIECLQSIKKNTSPNYELYLVDNCSNGGDVKVLKEQYASFYDSLMEIKPKNLGFTGGNNFALNRLRDRKDINYFLLLSNDIVADPNFLVELVKIAESNPKIGIVGPKIYDYSFTGKTNVIQSAGSKINLWFGKSDAIGGGQIDRGQFNEASQVDYVAGCCLLIKKELVEKIGLLNEKYFAYHEDTEWCMRAVKAGYLIFCAPESKIWHRGGATFGEFSKTSAYYGTRNTFLFEKKYANPLQFFCFFIYYFFKNFPRITGSILLKRRDPVLLRSYFKGIKDGLI